MSAASSPTPKKQDSRALLRALMVANKMPPAASNVIKALHLRDGGKGWFYMSMSDLVLFTGLSRATVSVGMKWLQENNLVEVNRRNSGNERQVSEYKIIYTDVKLSDIEKPDVKGADVQNLDVQQLDTKEPLLPTRTQVHTRNKKDEELSIEDKEIGKKKVKKVVVKRNSLRKGSTKKHLSRGQVSRRPETRHREPGADDPMERLRKFKQANPSVETGETKTLWEQDNEWIV